MAEYISNAHPEIHMARNAVTAQKIISFLNGAHGRAERRSQTFVHLSCLVSSTIKEGDQMMWSSEAPSDLTSHHSMTFMAKVLLNLTTE